MDKELTEEEFGEMLERLQEPIHQVSDAIESLLIKETKEPENPDLVEFKLQLSEIMQDFYNKMAKVHDEIIEGL